MPLPGAILAQMTDTVTHAPLTGRDEYGAAIYGAATSYQARVVPTHRLIRSPQGSDKVATTVAWIATTDAIGPEDRLTLPDGSSPAILQVDRYTDARLPHTRVFFG